MLASATGGNVVSAIQVLNPSQRSADATIADAALPSPLTITADQPVVIAGQTLFPGVTKTVSETPYGRAAGGSILAVGSSTIPLSTSGAYTTLTNPLLPSPLPITSGQPIVVDGTTLAPGAVQTISGTPDRLAPGSTALVGGSKTIAMYPSGSSDQSPGLLSGVTGTDGAGGPSSTAYTTNASYTGPEYLNVGVSVRTGGWMWIVFLAAVLAGLSVL